MAQDETDIEVAIDIQVFVQAIIQNSEAMAALTVAVRDCLTKDARLMGNLFAKWASTNPPVPPTRKRVR